nr:class I SAM-dependent methyltransferase [Paenibacillus elgii]
MFSGGSIALWNEIFKPDTMVGIDLQPCQENDYFSKYLLESNAADKIHRYWDTNQSDKKRIVEICTRHMGQGIDLVLDDASHLYEPTKRSFEALFPLLRPGGLYIIEDWNWAHTASFQKDTSVWRNETALTQLIFDVVEAVGSSPLISNVHVFNGYAVIEKCLKQHEQLSEFSLEKIISRRPHI